MSTTPHQSATEEQFESLALALEGWFDNTLEELPKDKRKLIDRTSRTLCFTWNVIDSEQRQAAALQWDSQCSSAYMSERARMVKLYEQIQDAKEKLARWQSSRADIPSEIKMKEVEIDKMRRQLAKLEKDYLPPPKKILQAEGGRQAGLQATKPGGRPPSQLRQGVEALYLEKLAAEQTDILLPGNVEMFMLELRRIVNGPDELSDKIKEHIRKVSKLSEQWVVHVQDPPGTDGKFIKKNEKPDGYNKKAVSDRLSEIRKRPPVE